MGKGKKKPDFIHNSKSQNVLRNLMLRDCGIRTTHKTSTKELEPIAETNFILKELKELVSILFWLWENKIVQTFNCTIITITITSNQNRITLFFHFIEMWSARCTQGYVSDGLQSWRVWLEFLNDFIIIATTLFSNEKCKNVSIVFQHQSCIDTRESQNLHNRPDDREKY